MNYSDKSRNLSMNEYLERLQLEYICFELRKKIYPRVKDKTYYGDRMNRKKTKIEDIAARNQLPTIFNDEEVKKKLYHQVYGDKGYPNFIYKDANEILTVWNRDTGQPEGVPYHEMDFINYYLPKSEVRVHKGKKVLTGGITMVNLEAGLVEVKISGKLETFKAEDVTRIL